MIGASAWFLSGLCMSVYAAYLWQERKQPGRAIHFFLTAALFYAIAAATYILKVTLQ